MIRADELATYLDTIARTVAQELRPELQTSHARKSADYVLEVLTRLLAQARAGEQIAAAQGQRWSRLCSDMGISSGVAVADDGNVFASFERDLDLLQQRWSAGAVIQQPDSPWFTEAVGASEALLEAIEVSCLPTSTAPSTAQEDDDPKTLARQLSAYLKRRLRELPDDVVAELKIAPGGNTKRTALLSLQPNAALPERLVLRQDRPVNLTGTQVTDEFPIIDRLHTLGIRVPTPILLEPDGSRLGGAFMLMEQVDAHPAGTYFAEDRVRLPRFIGPQFARDAAAELARLHRSTEVQRIDSKADRAVLRQGIAQAY
ncbi:MAG: phosphotransferase, partial [Steroidobacteraceae bacterium]